MNPDPNNPTILASYPTEIEATMIVNYLADEQIQARLVGANLAGIWPEVPREVQVVVRQADYARAQTLLENRPSFDD